MKKIMNILLLAAMLLALAACGGEEKPGRGADGICRRLHDGDADRN